MERKYILAVIVIVFIMLFVAGFFVGDQSVDVAGCTANWKTTSVTVGASDLCSSSCIAQPADQQHNAIVDALLCACEKAKTSGYASEDVNKRIQEVVSQAFGYTGSASDFCEQPGVFMIKRSYD